MCTSRGRQGWVPTMHTCEQASLESELMASVVITFREMQLQCSSVLQKKKKKGKAASLCCQQGPLPHYSPYKFMDSKVEEFLNKQHIRKHPSLNI